ncbi:Integral membrane protein [Apiospora saccharicola]|uniref:Integral membrane protein n=1 Tax=Apiospora saccharicola TaxID=335842 RepID=A0ABR1TQ94_9PEZI
MNQLFSSLLAASVILHCYAAPGTHEATAHTALSSAASPADLLTKLSTCALSCLVEHSPTFGCTIVDIECQCNSEPLYDALSTCMVRNCTLEETVGTVPIPLPTAQGFDPEFALITQHMIALAKVDAQQCNRPTDSLNGSFRLVYTLSSIFIYIPFVLRIISRVLITKQLWWDDFFHTVAICNPIWAGWTLQRGDATCLSFSVIAIGSAIFNVVSEIAIFLLPMPILITLNLELKKKLEAIMLLGIGLITIVVASVRIPSLYTLDGYSDSTYRTYPAFLWTALEILVAHLCVSAPAISALFKSMHKSLSTAAHKSDYLSYGEEGEQSKVSSARWKPAPRPPTRNGLEDDYGDDVELHQRETSSQLEANCYRNEAAL